MYVVVHHDQTIRRAGGVADRCPAGMNPPVIAVALPQPILFVETRRRPAKIVLQVLKYRRSLVGMEQSPPILYALHGRLGQAEHRLPTQRKVDRAAFDVPFPDAVIGTLDGQRISILQVSYGLSQRLAA